MSTEKNTDKICVHVFISGLVQGVGYRWHTMKKAQSLGIQGWVRNLPDSRVEAVFEGLPDALEKMIEWCHQGPSSAVVENVVVNDEAVAGFLNFEVRR